MPGPEVRTMSSRPNGPAVVYEYITNTKEKRPTFLRARALLWLDLPTGLPACVEFTLSPYSAREVTRSAITQSKFPVPLTLFPVSSRFPVPHLCTWYKARIGYLAAAIG